MTPNDFTLPVTYTVAAENGSTANYVVTLSENLELRYWGSTLANGTGSFDFGEVTSDGDSGARSGPAELAAFNTDSVAHTLGSVDVSSSDFDLSALSTMAIAAGEHATFAVSFDPVALGAKSGTVTVSNDDGGTLSLPVKGTGATPSAAAFVIHANVSEENVVMQCARSIATDSSGYLYVLGSSSAADNLHLLKKLDSSGAVISTGWPIEYDNGSNAVMSGRQGVAVDQATGDVYAVVSYSDGSRHTTRIRKYDSSGNETATGWDKVLDSSPYDNVSVSIMVDVSGNVYVAYYRGFYYDESGTLWDSRVAKYSSAGELLFDRGYDFSDVKIIDLALTN